MGTLEMPVPVGDVFIILGLAFEAAIGGTTGKLLEVNSQAILKIRANLAASQVQHLESLVCT